MCLCYRDYNHYHYYYYYHHYCCRSCCCYQYYYHHHHVIVIIIIIIIILGVFNHQCMWTYYYKIRWDVAMMWRIAAFKYIFNWYLHPGIYVRKIVPNLMLSEHNYRVHIGNQRRDRPKNTIFNAKITAENRMMVAATTVVIMAAAKKAQQNVFAVYHSYNRTILMGFIWILYFHFKIVLVLRRRYLIPIRCNNGKRNMWPWRWLYHFDFHHWRIDDDGYTISDE